MKKDLEDNFGKWFESQIKEAKDLKDRSVQFKEICIKSLEGIKGHLKFAYAAGATEFYDICNAKIDKVIEILTSDKMAPTCKIIKALEILR